MKNILVPFDFSKPSIGAFQFALKVAGKSGATVHLFHVVEVPVIPNTALAPSRILEQPLVREIATKIQSRVGKIVSQQKALGIKIVTHIEFGSAVRKILKHTLEHPIDLVVIGSHGVHGLREFLLGSVAEKIVRTSPVPVLVVKGPPREIKNIVFPNTLELAGQEDLVKRVKSLQKFFDAHLHIVYINTPANFTSDSSTIIRFHAFAKKYGFKNFTTSIYNHRYEDEGIIQFTKSVGADLVAMGTGGRQGLSHLMTGSMAEDVTNHIDALIWTYVVKKHTNN